MAVSFRAAKGIPPSLESFRAELGRQGFDHAAEIYAAIKKDKPDFKLGESAMNDWGYHLMEGNHLPEATALLKLNIQNYPDSSNAYTALGETYAKSGEKQLARDSYSKALGKDPSNEEARNKLKELDAGTSPRK